MDPQCAVRKLIVDVEQAVWALAEADESYPVAKYTTGASPEQLQQWLLQASSLHLKPPMSGDDSLAAQSPSPPPPPPVSARRSCAEQTEDDKAHGSPASKDLEEAPVCAITLARMRLGVASVAGKGALSNALSAHQMVVLAKEIAGAQDSLQILRFKCDEFRDVACMAMQSLKDHPEFAKEACIEQLSAAVRRAVPQLPWVNTEAVNLISMEVFSSNAPCDVIHANINRDDAIIKTMTIEAVKTLHAACACTAQAEPAGCRICAIRGHEAAKERALMSGLRDIWVTTL